MRRKSQIQSSTVHELRIWNAYFLCHFQALSHHTLFRAQLPSGSSSMTSPPPPARRFSSSHAPRKAYIIDANVGPLPFNDRLRAGSDKAAGRFQPQPPGPSWCHRSLSISRYVWMIFIGIVLVGLPPETNLCTETAVLARVRTWTSQGLSDTEALFMRRDVFRREAFPMIWYSVRYSVSYNNNKIKTCYKPSDFSTSKIKHPQK